MTKNSDWAPQITDTREALEPIGVLTVIDPNPILAQVDHQLHRTGREKSLLRVRVRRSITLVEPEEVDEVGERRPRSVGAEKHGPYHTRTATGTQAENPERLTAPGWVAAESLIDARLPSIRGFDAPRLLGPQRA